MAKAPKKRLHEWRITLIRKKGQYLGRVEAPDAKAEWSGVLRTVRAGMFAVPSRAAQRLPHLSAHDLGVIDSEVRGVLTEVETGDG
jgi:phage terminase Nu1 subunit (DNA packaging protein)